MVKRRRLLILIGCFRISTLSPIHVAKETIALLVAWLDSLGANIKRVRVKGGEQ